MDSLAYSTVLVTGATGFIGSHLVERLRECGAQVRALVRNPRNAEFLTRDGVEIVPGDITDLQAVLVATQGCGLVFHLVGVTGVQLPYALHHAVHVGGTENAARAALQAGVERFVYASSIAVYGLYPGKEINEDSPQRHSGEAYSDSKLQAEQAVRQLVEQEGLPAVIIQPGITYGPRDETWVLAPLRRIRNGKMILPGDGKALVQPIFVDDVVDGILLAAGQGKIGEAYILCGPEALTFRQYFTRLAALVDVRRIPSIPLWLASSAASAREALARVTLSNPALTNAEVRWVSTSRTFSGEKARLELGFHPQTNLEAGMKKVESWLAASGALEAKNGGLV